MIQFDSIHHASVQTPSAVAIGVFDGVHRGHQRLLRDLVSFATLSKLVPTVVTFYPYPDQVINGFVPGYCLTMPERKASLLADFGIETLVTQPFDDKTRRMHAEDFVDMLLSNLKMKALWVGPDFALGYKREGNVDFLTKSANPLGFSFNIVNHVDSEGQRISSSRIRASLMAGNVEGAAQMLGRPHRVAGTVVHGEGRGRTIGVPTANVSAPSELAIPSRGVYAARAAVNDGAVFDAVVNIGVRPTFGGSRDQFVEAHLLDQTVDLYGKVIALDFVSRLRDERKFDGVAALVEQIRLDIQTARNILIEHSTEN